MFGGVTGNEGSEWVDFVVLGFDVVEDVFVYHGVCLLCALSEEEELDGADWDEDTLARRTMLLPMHFLRR